MIKYSTLILLLIPLLFLCHISHSQVKTKNYTHTKDVKQMNKYLSGKWFNREKRHDIEFKPDSTDGGECIPFSQEGLMNYRLVPLYLDEKTKAWTLKFLKEGKDFSYTAIIYSLTKNELKIICNDAMEPIIDGTYKRIIE